MQQREQIGAALAEVSAVLMVRADMMAVYRILAEGGGHRARAPDVLEALATRVGKHVATLEQLRSPLLRGFLPHAQLEAGLLNHAMCADVSVARAMALPAALSLHTCRDIAATWRNHHKSLCSQPLPLDAVPTPPASRGRHQQQQQPQLPKTADHHSHWQENRVFLFLSAWVQHIIAKAALYFKLVVPPTPPQPPHSLTPPAIAGPAAANLPLSQPSPQHRPMLHQIPHLMDHAKRSAGIGSSSSSQQSSSTSIFPSAAAGAQAMVKHPHPQQPQQPQGELLETRFEEFVRRSGVQSAALLLNVGPGVHHDPQGYTCRAADEVVEDPMGMAAWCTLYAYPEGSFEWHRLGVVAIVTRYVPTFVPESYHHWTDSVAHMTIALMAVEQGAYVVVVAKERKGVERIAKEFCVSMCRLLRMADAFSLLRASSE